MLFLDALSVDIFWISGLYSSGVKQLRPRFFIFFWLFCLTLSLVPQLPLLRCACFVYKNYIENSLILGFYPRSWAFTAYFTNIVIFNSDLHRTVCLPIFGKKEGYRVNYWVFFKRYYFCCRLFCSFRREISGFSLNYIFKIHFYNYFICFLKILIASLNSRI